MQVNGHKISPATVIAILTALATLATSWFVWGQHAGKLEQRVQTIEDRQKEDRREARLEQKEIKADVKEVKEQVQQIRILLERRERSGR